MPNAFRQALEHGEFAVSCELVPGRGARGPAVEKALSTAHEIWRTGRVHALTVADNPGGSPALIADTVAAELLRDGITPLVHFTCKDRNRNQVLSQLYGLERRGVENLLLMTGDYQAGGWEGRARPVFDLDSVQVQLLVSQMNAGVAPGQRAGEAAGQVPPEPAPEPARFFQGCAVNPFKYRAGEVVPQYLKLEKKLAAGARFVVSQVGYDARKMQELLFYLADRGYRVPVIANVFVLSRATACRMRAGKVPGCRVSDALMDALEREARAGDGGRAARLERAAAQVAVARGLGFSGVHLGGAGLDAQAVTRVLDRAEELAPDWRACVGQLAFGEAEGCYLYEPAAPDGGTAGDDEPIGGGSCGDVGTVLNSHVRAGLSEDIAGRERDLFEGYGLSRLAHYWALTPGKRLNGAFGQVMGLLDERQGRYRRHRLEHAQKAALYGCVDCGDCGLEACFYSCPMAQCPKCQRNGPCGGSSDGWCEVFPEGSDGARLCIWYKAYHRARREGKLDRLGSFITLPNRWEFCGSSAWSNYTHGRDNCSRRVPVSHGPGSPGALEPEGEVPPSRRRRGPFPSPGGRSRVWERQQRGKGVEDMPTDIEIAQAVTPEPITEIARKVGIGEDDLELYGRYKAKVDYRVLDGKSDPGKLVLVTAINPTPAGEGKTTTTVGLADGLARIGKNPMVALREPSLGPVFGIKGGAAGGGYAQVVPMEDINLHFTGDFHAIGAANNLLAAMLDNHIQQGNELGIDPKSVTWKRCVDMNDRQLRNVVDGLGGAKQGVPREDHFQITVASEIMAIFCLATSISDLKERISRIIVAYTYDGRPVTAADLKAQGAMAALLKDALKPNLVQTLEGTPAFVHGGPFANIAHGCNSVMATRMAMKYGDYAITEAGFGADLGAEKFLDIKCRLAGLRPDAVVVVATVRSLKYNGGVPYGDELQEEDLEALERGLPNLLRHVENITQIYKLPCVVAINRFPFDTEAELKLVEDKCRELGVNVALSEVWAKGGEGGEALAREVVRLCEEENDFQFSYDLDGTIEEKLDAIARRIYHADGVELTAQAKEQARKLTELGFGGLPLCVAKTQYSFSDDPALLGAPEGFTVTVRELTVSAGAGFIVALTGDVLTMPGLPKRPSAEKIDVDENGVISGLF